MPENTEDPEPDDVCMDNAESSDKFLADTAANRQVVANRHGLLWGGTPGDSRHSVVDAIRLHRPPLKLVCVKQYLEALTGTKPQGSKKVLFLVERFVFLMLFIDLQSYETRRRLARERKRCFSSSSEDGVNSW